MKTYNNCRVCGSNNVDIFFEKENCFFWYGPENEYLKENLNPKQMNASIYFCYKCGFIGLVVNEQLKRMSNIFYSSPTSIPGTTHGQCSNYSISLTENFFDKYQKLVHDWVPESVLEVGCQAGFLLHKFKLMGTKTAIGIEPGNIEPFIDENGIKIDVRRGCLSKEIVDKSDFDLIICLFVLEHVNDINSFLSIIYDLLSQKGRLLLSVPNEYFALRDGNVGLLNMQHFNYFTPD
ncbi:D-mycarose 3-C-methyltransferase, partial [Candidatus Magnetomorum sp. HK-1]